MSEHTFVIPCYKNSSFLEQCIQSLMEQTHKSKVVITTSTPSGYITELADKYNIPVIVNQDAPSIAGDWNFALNACETRYCTLAHQDDIYLPMYAEKMLQAMKKNKRNLIAFCDYSELKNDRNRYWLPYLVIKRLLLTPFYLKNTWEAVFTKKLILRFGCPVCCPSVTFNSDQLKDFRFSQDYTVNLDWNAWLELACRQGAFSYVPQALMRHRVSSECETAVGLGENRRQEEDKRIFLRLWPKFIGNMLFRAYSLSYLCHNGK